MDLFLAAFPSAKWPAILALGNATAKGRVFNALRYGTWVPGERLAQVGGYDYRTRASRLRDLGIPVEAVPQQDSPCYQFRIPSVFLMAYEEMTRQGRAT
jgi:hypothetical protein